jgi:hypothetical protein
MARKDNMRNRRSAALPEKGTPAGPSTSQPENPQPPKPPTGGTNVIPAAAAEQLQQHGIAEKLGLKMDALGNLDIPSLAYVLYTSKMFPDIGSVSQGIVKIMVGKELGLAPMQSVMGVHIIVTDGGKKTSIMVGAHLIAAKIKSSGRYDYDVLEMDAERCELQPYVKREGDKTWRELKRISYTTAEALAAGLGSSYETKKFKAGSNWAKDPQAMCFARAITRMEKVHFADLTGTPTYTPDELGFRTDAAGNALSVKGILVPDDIPEEDLMRLQKSIDKQQPPGSTNIPHVPRQPVGGVKLARLQQICQDKGWPLLAMLDMVFSLNGYVNKESAERAWDAEANQTLLELIADDTYDQVVKALDEPHPEWLKRTEGHVQDEAEQIIDRAKEGSVTKVTEDATKVTPETCTHERLTEEGICRYCFTDCRGIGGSEPAKPAEEAPANGKGEQLLESDQYDDLWALISVNPKLIQAAKDFARQTLGGYEGLKTLRDLKQKHLAAVTDFAQRWGQQ